MVVSVIARLFPLLLISLMPFRTPAQQISFSLGVNSSGGLLYACNAGIRYAEPASEVCYVPNTSQVCDPGVDSNCVCSNSVGTGQWKNVGIRAVTSPIDSRPGRSFENYVSSEQGSFAKVVPDESFGTRIDEIEIQLGSERYGAEYFIDFCFHGSQVEWYRNKARANTRLMAGLGATDIASGSYPQLSQLNYKVEIACDQQGVGSYKWAHDGTSASPGSPVYNNFESNIDRWDLAIEPASGAVAGGIGTVVNSAVLDAGGSNAYGVRFCKVRYHFFEGATQHLRQWQRNDAQMKTMTKIIQQGS